jgi:CRP/FNR family transcriptional regulator, cyclic AMP receptor protein
MNETEYSPDSPYMMDNVGKYQNELDLLLSISSARTYAPGEVIYMQGEPSSAFYFVKQGKVKVSILKEDGSEKTLCIQEKNTFFGESGAFDRYPYFATATAVDQSEIQVIDVNQAEALIRKRPEVAFLVITAIIRKLRLLGLQVEDLSFLDAQKRIAHILLKLMDEVGEKTKDGVAIRRKLTHEDLGNLTGLSRVTVTNVLNYLARLRVIRKGRLALTILNRQKLTSLLGESLSDGAEGSRP